MKQYNSIKSYLESEHLTKDEVKNTVFDAALANAMEQTPGRMEAIAECLCLFKEILENVE